MVARWVLALAMAASVSLAGCVAEPVKQAERRAADPNPFSALDTQPIAMARVVSGIPRGTHIGSYSYGPGCDFGREETWEGDQTDLASGGFNANFVEALSGAGYRVVGDPRRLFDAAEERASARYLVGGQISEFQMSLCNHVNFWTGAPYGPRGDAYIKVRWQVYSVAERRVVYDVTTDGNARTEQGSRDGLRVLLQRAFASAASNLGADADFRETVAGRGPALARATDPAVTQSPVEIPRFANFTTAAAGRLADLRDSAVTIILARSHGSGFFISNDGLILTNRHVVGDAESVNVRLLSGVEVAGRVLRRHAVRDVALVKVDLVRTRPLPIRQAPLRIGEDVYALGAPVDAQYAGSLTRGIVSAVRREIRGGGVELDIIQSDAVVHGGSSGGPLLDSSGNVVGITVSGVPSFGQIGAGTNFFIPITDALERLNIRLGEVRELRF